MKILLLKTVPKIGQAGEVHNVADGYGQNYLIPQGLAVVPTDPRGKAVHAELAAKRAQVLQHKEQATKRATEWAGKTVTVTGKASPDGTLYAAVTEKDVAKELGLDAKLVNFDHVKQTGTYQATVKIPGGDSVLVTVVVSAQ